MSANANVVKMQKVIIDVICFIVYRFIITANVIRICERLAIGKDGHLAKRKSEFYKEELKHTRIFKAIL